MQLHPNARTTPQLRLQLVARVDEGEPVEEVARAAGVLPATAVQGPATPYSSAVGGSTTEACF